MLTGTSIHKQGLSGEKCHNICRLSRSQNCHEKESNLLWSYHRIFLQSTTVNVTVYISDVNDNSPQFASPNGYQFSVVEGTAGLTVGTIKVNCTTRICVPFQNYHVTNSKFVPFRFILFCIAFGCAPRLLKKIAGKNNFCKEMKKMSGSLSSNEA